MRWVVLFCWLLLSTSVSAHSWYPFFCCHERDCQRVDRFVVLSDGQYEIWAGPMHVVVPTWFVSESPDEDAHICAIPRADGEIEIVCFFAPLVQM